MKKLLQLAFSILVVHLLSACSSFFSGAEPLPINSADREIVNHSVMHLGFIPRVVDVSTEEKTKVYVFAFDGTENDRDNFDKREERQTTVGYLSSKLENAGFDVEYIVGPGVDSKVDSVLCYSCKEKASDALALLKDKITDDGSINSNTNIGVVVLGFSRGAAIGRHFMNLVSEMWPDGSSNKVRTYGLLFDTVATSVTDRLMLGIAPTSDYLVHFIARDERREMFPVIIDYDRAFEAEKVDNLVSTPRLTQLTLPGVHSDVGASYRSGIGSFYMFLGEIVLSNYGLLPQPSQYFNEDFFSQGVHDSRGWFSKIIGTESYLDKPVSSRLQVIKKSAFISDSRAESIVARNERNIPKFSGSYYQYNETHTLVFKVKKIGNNLEIISANTTYLIVFENLSFEKVDGKKYITFNYNITKNKQRLNLDNSVWSAIPENVPSLIEVVILKRNEKEELFILVNNKKVKKY